MSKIYKNYLFWVILLVVFSLIIKLVNLNCPDWQIFDEIYYYNFAKDYLNNNYFFDVHPPLGKLFISLGIFIFKGSLFGARFFQVLASSSIIYIIYLLVNKLFKNKTIAFFAAILMFFETSMFVEGRYALINIFIVFFTLISFYYFVNFIENKKINFFYLSLFFTSLAISVKWTATINLLIYFIFILIDKNTRNILIDNILKNIFKFIFWIFVSLFLPYLIIFLPDYFKGEKFISWHYNAYMFHKNLISHHPYASSWYKWFLDLRPVWFEYRETPDKLVLGIIEYGNPFIIIASTISFLHVLIKEKFYQNKFLFLIIISVFANIIPWILIKREAFFYHFIPILPFMLIILSYTLFKIFQNKKIRILFYIYFAFIIFFFLWFWPLLNGILISFDGYTSRIIFSFLR